MFNFSELKAWMSQYNVEKRAYDGFWLNFDDYKATEPQEFEEYFTEYEPSKLELKVDSVAINFSNNYPDFD
jgi:hypothetical protein